MHRRPRLPLCALAATRLPAPHARVPLVHQPRRLRRRPAHLRAVLAVERDTSTMGTPRPRRRVLPVPPALPVVPWSAQQHRKPVLSPFHRQEQQRVVEPIRSSSEAERIRFRLSPARDYIHLYLYIYRTSPSHASLTRTRFVGASSCAEILCTNSLSLSFSSTQTASQYSSPFGRNLLLSYCWCILTSRPVYAASLVASSSSSRYLCQLPPCASLPPSPS